MNIETIKKIFKNIESKPLEINKFYSVLLPIICIENEMHILYELRSKDMNTQPGEVSFPGGRVEIDESFREAAIRETCEEIGVKSKDIEIIGELDYIINASNFILYPYVGILSTDINSMNINKKEVEKIFTVPLSFFLENKPEIHNISYTPYMNIEFPYEKIPNGKEYKWRTMNNPVLFYEYDDKIIWGMTARITQDFINRIKINNQ